MKIIAWVLVVLFLVAGVALIIEALTTTHSVWLSIPLLVLSGALAGPALIALVALLGLYDLVIEVNGHRMAFRKREAD